jgi:hypothetical protein
VGKAGKKIAIELIYQQYKTQIDTIVAEIGGSYRKSAAVIAWLYGGTSESWRKFLPEKQRQSMPREVKEFFSKFKEK